MLKNLTNAHLIVIIKQCAPEWKARVKKYDRKVQKIYKWKKTESLITQACNILVLTCFSAFDIWLLYIVSTEYKNNLNFLS